MCVLPHRFDGRALMDHVPEEGSHKVKELTKAEQAMESVLCYERYRDLVRAYRCVMYCPVSKM